MQTHFKSKIAHMKAGRLLPSIQEPTRQPCYIETVAREDFLFIGRKAELLDRSAQLAYDAAWQQERSDCADLVRTVGK